MDGIMDVQLAIADASAEDLTEYPARTSRTGKLYIALTSLNAAYSHFRSTFFVSKPVGFLREFNRLSLYLSVLQIAKLFMVYQS